MSFKPHIILISETWLDASCTNNYGIENYKLEISSQPTRRGKSAAIFVLDSINYIRRTNLESVAIQHQSVVLELINTTKHVIVPSLYRSPSFPAGIFLSYIEMVIDAINSEHKLGILGGDVNFDILKSNSDEQCASFLNTLATYNFSQQYHFLHALLNKVKLLSTTYSATTPT